MRWMDQCLRGVWRGGNFGVKNLIFWGIFLWRLENFGGFFGGFGFFEGVFGIVLFCFGGFWAGLEVFWRVFLRKFVLGIDFFWRLW